MGRRPLLLCELECERPCDGPLGSLARRWGLCEHVGILGPWSPRARKSVVVPGVEGSGVSVEVGSEWWTMTKRRMRRMGR